MDQDSSNLDVLRAVAVMAVFSGHLAHTLGYIPRWVVNVAHMGVVAFFVHTALVLMLSLDRLGAAGGTWRDFYVRRAFRIYPLAILTVLIVVLFGIPYAPWKPEDVRNSVQATVLNVMLLQNIRGGSVIAPLWSLSFEVQMYVLLPMFYFIVHRYRLWVVPALLAAGIVLANIPIVGKLTLYFPCFLSGVGAYALSQRVRATIPAWTWWPLIALVWGAVSLDTSDSVVVDWFAAAAIGFAIPFVRENKPSKPAHLLAKYSYGIYLSHLPLMWLCFVAVHNWMRWPLFGLLSIAVPVGAFRFIEQPMIRAGKRISQPSTSKAAAAAA